MKPSDEPAIRTADALCGVDADYRIVVWNQGAEQLFGIPGSAAIGARCYEIVSGKDSQGRQICARGCLPMRLASRGQPVSTIPMDRTGSAGEGQCLSCQTLTVGLRHGSGPVLFHTFLPNRDRLDLQTLARRLGDLLRQVGEDGAAPGELPPSTQPAAQLTTRELEVLRLLRDGLSTKDIAARLGVSADTARTHVQNIRQKLHVRTRLQAVAAADQYHLL